MDNQIDTFKTHCNTHDGQTAKKMIIACPAIVTDTRFRILRYSGYSGEILVLHLFSFKTPILLLL